MAHSVAVCRILAIGDIIGNQTDKLFVIDLRPNIFGILVRFTTRQQDCAEGNIVDNSSMSYNWVYERKAVFSQAKDYKPC